MTCQLLSSRHRRISGIAGALALLAAAVTSTIQAAPVPLAVADFEIGPRGHVLTPVTLNETHEGVFAVDTGAGSNVLHPRFATEAEVESSPEDAIEAHGAHAATTVFPASIDSLQCGTLKTENVPAMVMDLSHIESPDMRLDGLIGAPLLSQHDVLFDFEINRLSFFEPGAVRELAESAGNEGIPIRLMHGKLIFFEVTINDVSVTALLDTGSGRSAINGAASTALGLGVAPATAMPASHQAGGQRAFPAATGLDVSLGVSVLTSEAPVGIIDLPVFSTLGMANEPTLLLGTNFLGEQLLAIDYVNARLYVLDSNP